MPLHLFSNKVIAISSPVCALVGAVMMGALMYTPLLVQAVRGGSPTDGGSSVAPMLVGWPLASATSARLLMKYGFRPLVRAGLVTIAAATIGLAWSIRVDAPLNVFRVVMFAMGSGMGFVMTAMLIAVQDSVDWKERGVATSSAMFFRTIGGAVMVGALGGLLAHGVGDAVPTADLAKMLGPDRTAGIAAEKIASYADALRHAMGPLFVVIAGCALLALAIGLRFPAVRVKNRAATAKSEGPVAPPIAVAAGDEGHGGV